MSPAPPHWIIPATLDGARLDVALATLAGLGRRGAHRLLERGDVAMTIEYSGDIIDLGYSCECDTYAYVIPDEGTNIWVDNLAIPVGAPNPDLANVFIDYILHPQVGADISNFTAYGSPNELAIELGLIEEELLENTSIYPDEETMERLFFINLVGGNIEQLYNDAWDELLIFLGQ